MILHLRQMEFGAISLSGSEDAARFGLEEADAEPAGALEYELDAGLSGGGLWVAGKLRLPVWLTCVRCLEKFAAVLDIPDFAAQVELDGRESIDLTEWVREDILLALPPYPKCDAEGERVCKASFPPVDHAPPADAARGEHPAWGVLDTIETDKLKES